tara:strand:- start:1513 stop:1767 length:255 start_codon:yes stop_codon:yes gene_type:complete
MKDTFKLLIFIFIFTKITSPFLVTYKKINTFKNTEVYIVKENDNLWKIAEKYNKNNKEQFISGIRKLNDLKNTNLYIDQKLLLP